MTETKLTLRVNGEDMVFSPAPPGLSVADLLERLALDPERVVVEYNGKIIQAAERGTTPLQDDDSLEIIHFVGGG